MLRPGAGLVIDSMMQFPEAGKFLRRNILLDHHDEVHVAVLVPIPDGEGTLQVSAAEVDSEDGLRPADQIGQHSV